MTHLSRRSFDCYRANRKNRRFGKTNQERDNLGPLTSKQLKAYFSEAKHRRDLHDQAMLMVHLGIRMTELAELPRSAVDFAHRLVRIDSPSGRSIRTVSMTKAAERILRRRLSGSRTRVFEWRCSASYAQHRSACQKSGFTFSLRSFRATFITISANYGVSSPVVAALCGHSMRSFKLFVHISEESKRRAMDAFERCLSRDFEVTNSGEETDDDETAA